MNVTPVLSPAPKLAEAVLSGDEKAARILAADLKAACEEPQAFSPWSLHNQRAAR
jgi:hypothetical protein